MTKLREESRSEHARLEEKLPWVEICCDIRRYVDLLSRFYGFYATWEPTVERGLTLQNRRFWQSRRKRPQLREDLVCLGLAETDLQRIAALPEESLVLESEAALLGSLYVIEGSTLGGQILSRAIETGLGLREGQGYSYFRSYGERLPQAWAEFRAHIAPQLDTDEKCNAAASAARFTFEILGDWLTRDCDG